MNDTITALATAPGVSGLSVIRISGEESFDIINKIFDSKDINNQKTHTIHYGKIKENDTIIDDVTVSIYKKPNSYTGEDVIEIGCHGGHIVTNEIIKAIQRNGARLAEPGEFTKRAFINGKIDLAQAEAVADIIHSVSKPGAQTAARQLEGGFSKRLNELREKLINTAGLLELELDFSEEDILFTERNVLKSQIFEIKNYVDELYDSFRSSEIFRSGFYVGIAGYPNSGKSTLFNSLLKRKRAITSSAPGTTRDYLEELIYLNGIAIKLFDTAGIRDTEDSIEIQGIRFVESIIERSDLIIILNDISKSIDYSDNLIKTLEEKYPNKNFMVLQNKIDKLEMNPKKKYSNSIFISAKRDIGIEKIKDKIEDLARKEENRVKDILVNQRQSILLKKAKTELENAIASIDNEMENEIIAIDIRNAASLFGQITGETWNDDVLNSIFSKFCIGK